LFDSLKVNNSSTNAQVSLTDLFEFEQYIKASLYNEIGLSANYNMKRERLTSAEVETNTDNLYPLVDDMINQRRKAVKKINEMFGTNIEVEFNSSWDNRPFNGASIHNVEEEVNGTELETEDVENVGDNVENPDSEEMEDVGKAEERGETETQNDDETTDETETETTDVSEEETTNETNVETEEETETETKDETEVETEEETTVETDEETETETEEEKEDEEKKDV